MPAPPLDRVQCWMQSVITHPDGAAAGLESSDARGEIDVPPESVEQVVRPSRRLTGVERLQIYANAYYARLVECLRQEFPAMAHALGEEAFDGFAFGYLQDHPLRSYTLADLAANFPRYLAETKPPDESPDGPGWPDFLIDLATVERTYAEVFDGPGVEGEPGLKAEDLAAVPAERWPEARLVPAPCLRLLTLSFPVQDYISDARRGRPATIPAPSPTHLVVTRRDYTVRRSPVPPTQFALLSALVTGERVGAALEQAAARPDVDPSVLAERLHAWFRQWAAEDYFVRTTLS